MQLFRIRGGFTFVEVLVVIALLIGITGLAIPFYQSFQVGSQLDNTTQELNQTLRRAQAKAMAAEDFSAFGVHFETGSFTIFKGVSYIPGDIMNEVILYPSVITITPAIGSDAVFSSVSGETVNAGTIIITATNGASRTIIINDLGVIDAS